MDAKVNMLKNMKRQMNLLQIVTAGTKVETSRLVKESISRYIEDITGLDESEIRQNL